MGKSIENMYADITIKGLMEWWLYLQLLVTFLAFIGHFIGHLLNRNRNRKDKIKKTYKSPFFHRVNKY